MLFRDYNLLATLDIHLWNNMVLAGFINQNNVKNVF